MLCLLSFVSQPALIHRRFTQWISWQKSACSPSLSRNQGFGQAVYVTYSQAVKIWREEYGARPNVFYRDGVEPPTSR
jgi:hypothetical protein